MTTEEAFAEAIRLHQAGRLEEAAGCYQGILAEQPEHFGALANLGQIYRAANRFDDAIAVFQQALRFNPDQAGVLNSLGLALGARGRRAEAIEAFRRSLSVEPNSAEIHRNLAKVLIDHGQFAEAVEACHRALQLKSDFAEAYNNLGTALAEQGQLDPSIAAYQRALQLQPLYPQACNNLGTVLQEQGRLDEAMQAYRRAIQIQPDFSRAKLNYALMLLLHGDFYHGWPLYESRWDAFGYAERKFSQPRWDGGPLNGHRILLHTEQGLGDAIHFIRYAKWIAERGGEVIVECPSSLVSLFQDADGVHEVVCAGETLPPFDLHSPILSLPLLFKTRSETIPAGVPYLHADPVRREGWRDRICSTNGLRVGLAWAGNPSYSPDRYRSIHPEKLQPLFAMNVVEFVSLQVVQNDRFSLQHPEEKLLDFTAQITDFADCAALVTELDLIITVDTATAHLAGALGRPVWTLLPFIPDWRWGLQGQETPWYPTMRLFRQSRRGDWEQVVESVARELEVFREGRFIA